MSARPLSQTRQYYRPYTSESDTGSESESETESESSWYSLGPDQQVPPLGSNDDGIPNFRAFATQLQLRDAGGIPLPTDKERLDYGHDTYGRRNMVYSRYPPAAPDANAYNTDKSKNRTTLNTLITIDSRFRDRTVYPQPTFFRMRLPRPYKDINNLQISQMSFLNTLFYFQAANGNTDLTLYESGRVTTTTSTVTVNGSPSNIVTSVVSTFVKSVIQDGTYNINQLVANIQRQINYTPPFYDFPNGYNDFNTLFQVSGDLGVNFNEPGDYFYNPGNNTWIPNPTKEVIVNQYWKVRYVNLYNYTVDQVNVAYYYPPLWNALYDSNNVSNVNLSYGITGATSTPTLLTTNDVYEYLLYQFTGISDPIATMVINCNILFLDSYRTSNTFRYANVNEYTVSYDTQSQKVYFTTDGLNTSLINLLTTQRSKYYTNIFTACNITSNQYVKLTQSNQNYLAVLQGMYQFMESNFLTYFGVPWNQYTLNYYANLNWTIFLRNGSDAVGIPSNTTSAYIAGISSFSNDILTLNNSNPTYYWPHLSSITQSTISYVNLSSLTDSNEYYNRIYNVEKQEFSSNDPLITSSNTFYTEYLTKSANAVCPVKSGSYTVFKFKSLVRQTIQVETLPRPTQYRIPLYNSVNYDSNINSNFDLSYVYQDPPYPANPNFQTSYDNINLSSLVVLAGWTPAETTYGISYTSSLALASSILIDINTPQNSFYGTFSTPNYPGALPDSNYIYEMNLSAMFYDSTYSTPTKPQQNYNLFIYHDRAGFQADTLFPQNEHLLFIKYSSVVTSNMTSTNISFMTYPLEQYYILLRPQTSTFQGQVFTKVVPWFSPSPSQSTIVMTRLLNGINPAVDTVASNFSSILLSNWNYAQVYDSNYLRLPITSTLWGPDNPAIYNSTIQIQIFQKVPIGYDINDVSNDYTDYIPFDKNSTSNNSFYPGIPIAIDPTNEYQFSLKTPYNSNTETYFSSESQNVLYYPSLNSNYSPSTIAKRQTNIVHYYSPNYIAESDIVPSVQSLISPLSNQQLPYSLSTTTNGAIPGYTYSSSNNLALSLGVIGFSILPDEGVWDLSRLMFRSAISDSNNDPNANIQYMGIYNMENINNTTTNTLSLSNAIFVLSNSSRVTYTSNTESSPGVLAGFDVKGGTYYEFLKASSTLFPQNASGFLLGYSQPKGAIYNQPESIYTAIAFSASFNPTTIKALSGSAVPYPLYNNAFVSTAYLNGTTAPDSNYGVVFPSTILSSDSNYAPTSSDQFSETQSQYALSIPIATSVINYKVLITPDNDSNFMIPWPTTHYPTKIIASVPGYILLQDTNVYIYQYNPVNYSSNFSTLSATITPDEIFPFEENTNFVSITGNSQEFYFLGLSTVNTTSSLIRMKSFDPVTNILSDVPTSGTLFIEHGGVGVGGGSINNFTMADNQFLTISFVSTLYYSGDIYTGPLSNQEITIPDVYAITHDMDVRTNMLWYMTLDSNYLGSTLYSVDMSGPFTPTYYTIATSPTTPDLYSGFAVNMSNPFLTPVGIQLYFISQLPGFQSNMYFSSNIYPLSNSILPLRCASVFSNSHVPTSITVGAYTSVWVTVDTLDNNVSVWNNISGIGEANNGTILNAWQIFYPFQRIVMTLLSNSYNPIPDLSNLSYPEYPHSAMFYYDNTSDFEADIVGKWGLESTSNFKVADTSMSGYYFNSYIFNLPVSANVASSDYHYLAVRGYCPTETFETLIRFNSPNVYDFGYMTFQNIIDEIILKELQPQLFNTHYSENLGIFDQAFSTIQIYGQGYAPTSNNFAGSTIVTTGFSNFITLYSTIFNTYNSNIGVLSSINGYVNSNMTIFISTQLQYILPPYALTRENYTDPLLFQILWKSSLTPKYASLQDNWGLGYNLGYAKLDTPLSTYTKAGFIYKIIQQEIFLRLNPELSMNRIDTTFTENNAITHDSTGNVRNYFAKLLLDNFNNYCTTMLQRPSDFNPALGRLEQLSFQWVDSSGNQINNVDCDWKAVLQIEEGVLKPANSADVVAFLSSAPD